ncbi:hypothetical protein GA0074692_6763 [Micromonospora pallida]|uniref:Uncharacterized protein n=1 Tax=Micromonospora pallida TaxID=145854 RepID=A0A1C6TN95_9ACTN|nr:hypothetical protein [Micromonospora pallida]SCL43204.1 hypothetical protein GA0074692_6763 [Micromonospora pallida]
MNDSRTISTTHLPASVDPDRVLAVCAVMGWPDDRGEQYQADAALMPAEAHYRLAEEIVRAVDQVGPSAGHVLEITADDTAALTHPPVCFVPDQAGGDTGLVCLLADLVDEQVPLGDLAAGRYEIALNDLGDRVSIGDRIDGRRPGTGQDGRP